LVFDFFQSDSAASVSIANPRGFDYAQLIN